MSANFFNLYLSMSLFHDGHNVLLMNSVFVFLFHFCEIRIWFVLLTYFIIIWFLKIVGDVRENSEFLLFKYIVGEFRFCKHVLPFIDIEPDGSIKELCLYGFNANFPVKISFCRIFNIYISYTFSASLETYYVHSQWFIQKQNNLQYWTALWRCFKVRQLVSYHLISRCNTIQYELN